MYFSKITLKHDLEKAKLFQILCPDEYKIHQHLWALFDLRKDQKRDFLYRRDEDNTWPRFFTVSQRIPKDENDLWDIDEPKPYEPKLKTGQRLSFSLVANPVVNRKIDEFRKTEKSKIRDKTGKKHKRIKRDDIIWLAKKELEKNGIDYLNEKYFGEILKQKGTEWLALKGKNKGFKIKEGEVIVDSYMQMKFYKKGLSDPIKISTLCFTGILTVINPEQFINEALFKGLGPAKSFGCGLLLIKPL